MNPSTYAERLLRVEPDLYKALESGDEALEQFACAFEELLQDLDTASQLDESTAILASHVATRVGCITEGLHRLQVRADELVEGAVRECEAIALECSVSLSE
jgi:hypothetical protein